MIMFHYMSACLFTVINYLTLLSKKDIKGCYPPLCFNGLIISKLTSVCFINTGIDTGVYRLLTINKPCKINNSFHHFILVY